MRRIRSFQILSRLLLPFTNNQTFTCLCSIGIVLWSLWDKKKINHLLTPELKLISSDIGYYGRSNKQLFLNDHGNK